MDKIPPRSELLDLLKNKLERFPRSRFNVQQIAKTYKKIVANLNEHNIPKIDDFSENYTCLWPEEIESLHWAQATVYPIVVLKEAGDVREGHLKLISDNRKHDVPFVELCNEILHRHHREKGLLITHDVEYKDGCASQFKCIRAFSSLARHSIKTTRIFCETSHGKSKSDGLAGFVKSYATRAVCGKQNYIPNANELFDFLNGILDVEDAYEATNQCSIVFSFTYLPRE